MQDEAVEASRAPLTAHFVEFKRRFMVALGGFILAFIIAYTQAEMIYAFLVQPLADNWQNESQQLIYTGLTEVFFTYLKLSFWAAFLLSFPVLAYQVYAYMAPGLYKHERQAFLPFLVASPVLFFSGAAIAYYGVFPLAWQFFLSFQTDTLAGSSVSIDLQARVAEYLSLSMQLILAFGLAFQMPVALSLLARAGLVKAETLAKGRKFAVIILLTAAAILTPPDIISQVALATPLYLLYELSIVAARLMERNRQDMAEHA